MSKGTTPLKRWLKRTVLATGALGVLGAGFVGWANFAAVNAGRDKLYNDVAQVPAGKVALVFGTDDRTQGRENLYFRYRIDAAEKLWKAGKVRLLLVSGDNRQKHYNEPEKMKAALIKRGVPQDRIVCDYAGLRTLDSVVRAKEIFGVDDVVFVSQRFHNERAAYLAKANGIAYCGFNAQDVATKGGLKTKVREVGARVKMWLDVRVLGTRPRHLGDKVPLPE
ncbi:YdcF family protein [Luteolibacter flavescens]|uniref:YdcF family protein n=1 Tax=Luteolibacter flavescens TaxID=1859460 RepID=A0ABT3FRZ0_9BACT|nr:ElyC/SanA/YdcF family protein [Luteolibacter flavescens]MCW1885964.1 YdcF family protein [Luteolibacter flavescens]